MKGNMIFLLVILMGIEIILAKRHEYNESIYVSKSKRPLDTEQPKEMPTKSSYNYTVGIRNMARRFINAADPFGQAIRFISPSLTSFFKRFKREIGQSLKTRIPAKL